MHGHQLVYNVPTLLKLRQATGPIVGAILDPSHLFWMGTDPMAAVDVLGDAIHHVHANDT
jgi:sugar phosphate isomerase/epimerase